MISFVPMNILGNLNISTRENNLTFVRLLAAVAVVFSHAMVLNDGKELVFWGIGTGYFGTIAVSVFFSLSGFLITQSYLRSKSASDYLEARVLRIFPGLFFTAILTILLIHIFGNYIPSAYNSAQFFLKTITLKMDSYHDYFASNPKTATPNGSLWTLETEFKYYILVMFLGLLGVLKRPALLLTVTVVAFILYYYDNILGNYVFQYALNTPMHNAPQQLLNLPLCFLLGVFAFLYRRFIPVSITLAILLLIPCFFVSHAALYAVAWSYAAFVVGFHPKLFMPRLVNMTDLSYGIYITSFPIQQLLVLNFPSIGKSWFFVTSLLLTLIASRISWEYFEKPGLSYRGKFFSSFGRLKSRITAKLKSLPKPKMNA